MHCTYPPSKPTCFVEIRGWDDISFNGTENLSRSRQPFSTCSAGAAEPSLSLPSGPLEGFTAVEADQAITSWFTSPETWKIIHFEPAEQNNYSITDLKRHIARTHRWLVQWVEKESNPFIHPRLYRARFPESVQVAYTTMSCYINKTQSNEQTVVRIIGDRAKQLLKKHNVYSLDHSNGDSRADCARLDAFEHLARVQALLVYQILGLFDGDIRLRHLAESHIEVLNGWMVQMVEQAKETICLGSLLVSSAQEQRNSGISLRDIAQYENILWYSWILAESIRRTWLVASGVQAMYLLMQHGKLPSPCMGGMKFTTRKGVWEAQSAVAWEKICSEVNVGLMHMEDADKLFLETAPEDVNDFAKEVLEVTYGIERLERWGVQVED